MKLTFLPNNQTIDVPPGTLLSDAAQQAGLDLQIPCGGQGRCGRCMVLVETGQVTRRATQHLAPEDIAAGYALACQTTVESEATVRILPQQKIERRLKESKQAAKIELPFAYDPQGQPIHALPVHMAPPSLEDQTDDWSRLQRALGQQHDLANLATTLPVLQRLGHTLRESEWAVTALVDRGYTPARLIDVRPGTDDAPPYGVAIDIGTTSNHVWLVDLSNGQVITHQADYNGQIARGEDVISRIIYASKGDGLADLQRLVIETLNRLLDQAAAEAGIDTEQVYRATVAGNSTMIHLFAAIPPEPIRLMPFITTANQLPPFPAAQIGLHIHPQATVDCLPGVASYVGSDITAGVVSAGMHEAQALTLFIDIGTNGEMALGDGSWLIACACSAGPAFEGAGVTHGMRATAGAIDEVWLSPESERVAYRVIGDEPPRGICGSGLIALLAEMFSAGAVDKSGNLAFDYPGGRVREGANGAEFVVAPGTETVHGKDIVITKRDIDNLMRAKAAIYAGFAVLAQSVGVDLQSVENVLIGGAFGQYINVEKTIQIGMLPDLPYERFRFLGNTSLRGAYLALLSQEMRHQINEVGEKMTYLELSADNTFFEAFNAAMFLPHTDEGLFPSVHMANG